MFRRHKPCSPPPNFGTSALDIRVSTPPYRLIKIFSSTPIKLPATLATPASLESMSGFPFQLLSPLAISLFNLFMPMFGHHLLLATLVTDIIL